MVEPRREEDGKFPTYAWPGGYTIIYLMADGEVLCPDCANLPEAYTTKEKREAQRSGADRDDPRDFTDKDWEIVAVDVYDEGPPLHCANCNKEIESSYGDPEEEEGDLAGRELELPLNYYDRYILSIYDNGKKTDIYTVYLRYESRGNSHSCIFLSKDCDGPKGVNAWGSGVPSAADGVKIPFDQLPENVQMCVFKKLHGLYSDKKDSVAGRRIKIYNPITYEGNSMGHYLVKTLDGKHEMYVQTDYDFPGLAQTFGWNGKILPMTKLRAVNIDPKDTTSAEIYSAIQYLDKNEGKIVEDPGYWEGEYTTEEENDAIKAAQTVSVTAYPAARKWTILAIYDAPEFADRYSIYVDKPWSGSGEADMMSVLTLSDNCNMPNGVNMWSSGQLGPHNGKKITFGELPPQVQKCALARLNQ
jgi:hypothetical protein